MNKINELYPSDEFCRKNCNNGAYSILYYVRTIRQVSSDKETLANSEKRIQMEQRDNCDKCLATLVLRGL